MPTGVRFELFELASQPLPCRDVIFGGSPIWVCGVATAGTTPRSVPTEQTRPFGHVASYVLRITAHEEAYVLVGRGTLAPTAANGILMLAGTQVLVLAAPGDYGAWAA